jgi:NADH-quinone oxidoreductase subunit N
MSPLPLFVVASAAVALVLAISIRRNQTLAFAMTCTGLVLACAAAIAAPGFPSGKTWALFVFDGYAKVYTLLVLLSSLAVAMLSRGYLSRTGESREEFYVFLLLATLGALIIISSGHFATFFLGLEILSVPLYALIAFHRQERQSVEAGLKYLVLAAIASGFLLFGMALIYADLGVMQFSLIAAQCATGSLSLLTTIGLAMVLAGVGFKLALVPFHFWAPDVYQGAPAPVTAFIATVSKAAMFALFMRYYGLFKGDAGSWLKIVIGAAGIASMFIGNLLALHQENVKRIIACSSIAHMGYFMVAFLGAARFGTIAATYYLCVYVIALLGALGTLTLLSSNREPETLGDLRGLFFRRPFLTGAFSVALLSLAGIPITAGFFGKLYVVSAGMAGGAWALTLSLIISSLIGLYYYLRILLAMHNPSFVLSPPAVHAGEAAAPFHAHSLSGTIVVAAATLLIIVLGVWPGPLLEAIRSMITG